jgi:organic hydroperoxide reductase OsmC/OhrA
VVATVKPKVLSYAVALDRAGRFSADDEPPTIELGDEWTPDHMLLAAVLRCSVVSLAYHARRGGIDVTAAGTATGEVTIPDGEQRFRFVEVAVALDVELEPRPEPSALAQLLERAERDCFVGASLVAKPTYSWQVR